MSNTPWRPTGRQLEHISADLTTSGEIDVNMQAAAQFENVVERYQRIDPQKVYSYSYYLRHRSDGTAKVIIIVSDPNRIDWSDVVGRGMVIAFFSGLFYILYSLFN